jgi:hypothetical protein
MPIKRPSRRLEGLGSVFVIGAALSACAVPIAARLRGFHEGEGS